MKNSLIIPITSIAIKATTPLNEPRLAAQAARQPANDVSPLQNQRSADCSCGSRRSYIQVTLTNGRRLKLRTAIRK